MKAKAMTLDISFMPMRVLIDGHDTDGKLVLADNQLAAVFVRLEGSHHAPEHRGGWHLEAGFGKCNVRAAPLFRTPEEAGAWVEQTLMSNAVVHTGAFLARPGFSEVSARSGAFLDRKW
jgi:hypothetical protein